MLQPSDICINFPVAEITYLSAPFLKFLDENEILHEICGHLFAKKILVSGKLFIDEFNSVTSTTSTQIDLYKSHLMWAYKYAKCNEENPFNNLSTLYLSPNIRTSDGKLLDTPEKLTNWMSDLYQNKTDRKQLDNSERLAAWLNQNNMVNIVSYNNFIPISQLRDNTFSVGDFQTFDEKQPEVANFKEKLDLKEWVGDSIYINLTKWVKDFHLLQGLIINRNYEIEISKKIALKFIKIPYLNPSDNSYLEMINSSTKLEANLISNNIFSIKNLSSFSFIKDNDISDISYGNYKHILVKNEKYEILLDRDHVKPTKEFEKAIEEALNNMKPLKALQEIFNEYGHLFSQRIILGSSLKNILPNTSSDISNKINLESPTFETLKSHLDNLNIEEKDLSNWVRINNLEIIEFDKITSLYKILEAELQRKIDNILNKQDNYKIIMTGITDLKDLDNKNTEYYKHVNIRPSLEDESYEVLGFIISKNYSKSEEFFVKFGSYDLNGFPQ